MGYTTTFTGELKFKEELSASQLSDLNKILDEDCRDHPEWEEPELYYVKFELLPDFSGIRWDGSEKFYDATKVVNMITRIMRKNYPNFELEGSLNAQGEDFDDRWTLSMDSGEAKEAQVEIVGQKVTCPHCEEKFIIEETVKN